jgi:hypothetical protein
MNISETGHSILHNVMSIIDKLSPEECEAFKAASMEKRKQPKYYQLFQHLKTQSDAGTSAEEISENELRAWAERKTSLTANYSDLIDNLQKKLLDFVGQRYAERQAASWYAEVNQLLDQADGLMEMGLRHHAKVLIEKALAIFEGKNWDYVHQWNTSIGRLCFVQSRYHQNGTENRIVWTDEMHELVNQLSLWEIPQKSRRMHDAKKQEGNAAQTWRVETIFLAIMRLMAQHFGDQKGELNAIRKQYQNPSSSTKLALNRTRRGHQFKEQPTSPQEEALNDIERVLLRLAAHHLAVQIADIDWTIDIEFIPNSIHPGIHFYPAASMWAMYQFQTHQLAGQFALPRLEKDDSDHKVLSAWQAAMEKEINLLPLRLEFHQVLVMMGNCDFGNALTRIRELLQLKGKQRQAILPQLKLLELLAEFENGNPNHLEIGNNYSNYLFKKTGQEWEFHKAFSQLMQNAHLIDRLGQPATSTTKERLAEVVAKVEASANRFDPAHQLVLWRIRSWASGEGR